MRLHDGRAVPHRNALPGTHARNALVSRWRGVGTPQLVRSHATKPERPDVTRSTPSAKKPGPACAGPGSTACGLPLPQAAARSDADAHRLHNRQPRIAAGVPPRHEPAGAGVTGYFDSDDHDVLLRRDVRRHAGSFGSIVLSTLPSPVARSFPALKLAVTWSSARTSVATMARHVAGISGVAASTLRIGRAAA